MFGCKPVYGSHGDYDPLWEPPELMIFKEKKPMSVKPVKVRVCDRWRVVHEGNAYTLGDELTVPEDLADDWERNGWVERVKATAK